MKQDRRKATCLKHLKESAGIVSYACEKTGISRRTYYNWYNDDEDFRAKCDDIIEMSIDIAESKLLSAINEGNLTATIFYLKTKGRNRGYVEKREDDVNISSFEQLMRDLPDKED